MAYQKYIKKNGKVYGPYLYHSRRVNDKVISEYYGHQTKRKYKFLLILTSFVLLFFLAIYGFNHYRPYFSGKAIFNLDAEYQEGEPLKGVLTLSLKQGELIPSSAKVVFNNNGNLMEYPLSEILLEEETSEGDFYVQGKNISGEGGGYGLIGEKEIYPQVYFSLSVYSEKNSKGGGGDSGEEIIEGSEIESEEESSTEEVPVVETEEKTPVEEEIPVEETGEESIIEEPEIASEEGAQSEISVETQTESPAETQAESSSEPIKKELKEESKEEKKESKEEKKSSDDSGGEATSSSESESSADSSSITGNIISNLFRGISNLFLSLTGTGKVVVGIEKKLEGSTSFESPFIYDLKEGESVELKGDSVYVLGPDGEPQKIEDSFISFDIVEGRAIVSTDYSEIEKGFGEEYLGNEEKNLNLNLSSLNLSFEKGSLSITLVYGEEEVVSLTTAIEEGEIFTNETLPEIPPTNETIFLNQTNQTLDDFMEFVSSENLSEEEKAELSLYFGNFSIETTKSEIFNDRLIRNYQLGDYVIEYSYDYFGEITPELEIQMEKDLMKWLRDVLAEVSKKRSIAQPVDSLLGNLSLEE